MNKRGYFENYVIQKMIRRLEIEGQKLCEEASRTKSQDLKERSGQLNQSYIYVICYDGIIYGFGDASHTATRNCIHKGLKNTGWEDGGGADWSNDFFENIGKRMRNVAPAYRHHGFDLFILNVAYYAQFLEDGSYAKGLSKIFGHTVDPKKWEITSQMKASCNELASRLKWNNTRVERIGWDGLPLRPNNRS